MLNKKIALILIIISVFGISGCTSLNSKKDVIKITSENAHSKADISNENKSISLDTGAKLLEDGKTDEAVKFFEEYKDFFSQDTMYYFYAGKAYLKAENKVKALKNFLEYIARSNDNSKNDEIREDINKLTEPVFGTEKIGQIYLSDKADTVKRIAGIPKQAFHPDTKEIFASVEVVNPQKTDKIKINWIFLNDKNEDIPVNSSEFSVSSSQTVLLSIKAPVAGWIAGNYKMQVFVNEEKTSSLKFYIF